MIMRKYTRLAFLVFLYILFSNTSFAQVKEGRLKTGIYKFVEKSGYKVIDAKSQETFFLDPVPVCTIEDFKKLSLTLSNENPIIRIELGNKGTEKLAIVTKDARDLRMAPMANKKPVSLALITDGELISGVLVQSKISTGIFNVSVDFTVTEAQRLIDRIKKDLPEGKPKTKEEEQKESEIREACANLDMALIHGDSSILKELLHDQLSLGHSNGLIETKKELLQHLQNGYLEYLSIEQQGYNEIQLIDNIVSVRRQMKVLGETKEERFEVNLNVLETWIMKDKKWQLLNRQAVKKVDGK